jgi:hypothetical protein
MSKKYKHFQSQPSGQASIFSHEAEYKIIKFDLIIVVILNAVYLAGILALYYGNQHSHFLDNWFAKVLHF